VNPLITGWERKLIIKPKRKLPIRIWKIPTNKAKVTAYAIYYGLPEVTIGSSAAAVIKETIATGPVASCLLEPNNAEYY
jgi:hypothetical protein